MKKLSLVVLGVMMVFVFCYAEEAAQTVATAAPARPQRQETLSFTGQAISITLGNTYTGTQPKIGVVSDKGEKMMFTLTPGTQVVNEQSSVIMLSDVPEGSMVTVDYTQGPGEENGAVLIEVLSSGDTLLNF